MTEEYKQYMEERFNRVFDKLNSIHDETKRTNGRVSTLEGKVSRLQADRIHRIESCPQVKTIEEIQTRLEERNRSLMEYDVLRKHPITVIGIVLVTVGVLAAGVFNAFSAFWEFIKTIR
jgi:uncharacterized protein YdcH (DUF465 family)